jgi:hypothetical protein
VDAEQPGDLRFPGASLDQPREFDQARL